MRAFFMARGTCSMGRTSRDKDGNVIESTLAQFTVNDAGGCVAIGELNPETMQLSGPIEHLFGDWDAAGYLGKALELLKPDRPVNIPDLKLIVQAAYAEGNDLICDYCQNLNCPDCIIREWKDEV